MGVCEERSEIALFIRYLGKFVGRLGQIGSAASNTTYMGRRQIRLLLRWAQGYHAPWRAAGSTYSSRQVSGPTIAVRSRLGYPGRRPNLGEHFERDFDMRRKRGRDATNGRFITVAEARKRPRETIIETVRKPCPSPDPTADEQDPEVAAAGASGLAPQTGSCSV
jgi:hypothetical protein